MQRYVKIPLFFFFIAATAGLLLRWHFISPLENLRYPFLLHTHSHIMFLGWVFNTLYLGYVESYVKSSWASRYRWIFILLQILVLAMSVSFPLQGYGIFSITFSTLHTLLAVVFVVRFLRDLKQTSVNPSISSWFVKSSLGFFLLSSAGPFALGFIMANGLGQSNWYYFAVYYYLHFQYNGFFLFGIFGLFFKLLEERQVVINRTEALRVGYVMAIATSPAYLLSVLWANPGWIFNFIGFLAAGLQVIALILFTRILWSVRNSMKEIFNPFSLILLRIVLISLYIKITLQLLSAFPQIASLAYEIRTFVIAYLHLVLLGIISLFLLFWYVEKGFIHANKVKPAFRLFLGGLTGMEALLIASPYWSITTGFAPIGLQAGIFIFSIFLWISAGWFALYSINTKKDN